MKWKNISIDQERKIEKLDTYEIFMEIVNEIKDGSPSTKKLNETHKDSIKSYGVILVYEDELSYYYFIGELRTTIEFTDLIRNGPDPEKLYNYLCLMTEKERELLVKYDHSKLWDDLLMGLQGFEKRKEVVNKKYNKFAEILPKLVELTESQTTSLPFGFPKGRLKKGDATTLAAAIRELKEEAKIDLEKIVLMLEDPIEEVYSGTDKQIYTTTYFIIKAEQQYEPEMEYLNTNCISEVVLSEDFENYIWFPIPKQYNLKEITTPLNSRRENMLFKVHKMLLNNLK